jgi:AraC-like DNA-binding protein
MAPFFDPMYRFQETLILDLREADLGLKRTVAAKPTEFPSVAERFGRDAMAEGPFAPLWRVANGVDPEAAGALSRKVLGRIVRHDAAAPGEALPFAARAVLTTSPDLGLMSCFDPASRWRRTDDGDAAATQVLLLRPADGRIAVELGGVRATVRAREAILLPAHGETRFALTQNSRIDLIRLEAARIPALADGLMRPVPRANRSLQVLGHYGAMVLRGFLPLHSAELRALAAAHIHDLVDLMLRDRSIPAATSPADRRIERIAAVKADIEARLERRDLGIELIARLHGVTPRAIQKLFETEAQTFSEYVLERRLERAWHRLAAARAVGLTISAVAFEVGFGDLSYFNRSFRKRFGQTPSQALAEARRSPTVAETAEA